MFKTSLSAALLASATLAQTEAGSFKSTAQKMSDISDVATLGFEGTATFIEMSQQLDRFKL